MDVRVVRRRGAGLETARGEVPEPRAARALALVGAPPTGCAARAHRDGYHEHTGAWTSGKARDFGSRMRRFESSRPNHDRARPAMRYDLKLFSGNANRPLAEEIAQYLSLPVSDAEISRFSDGEVFVQVNENVRGTDVFVVQPTSPPVNDNLMELLVMIDALKRASARRITAVLPYYGYARQDRKVQPRVPITAKLVADLLTAAGVDR